MSRIQKQLKLESVELEPGVDDRAYQVQVINSHWLKDCSALDSKGEEDAEVICDQIGENQKYSEIAIFREKIQQSDIQIFISLNDTNNLYHYIFFLNYWSLFLTKIRLSLKFPLCYVIVFMQMGIWFICDNGLYYDNVCLDKIFYESNSFFFKNLLQQLNNDWNFI